MGEEIKGNETAYEIRNRRSYIESVYKTSFNEFAECYFKSILDYRFISSRIFDGLAPAFDYIRYVYALKANNVHILMFILDLEIDLLQTVSTFVYVDIKILASRKALTSELNRFLERNVDVHNIYTYSSPCSGFRDLFQRDL